MFRSSASFAHQFGRNTERLPDSRVKFGSNKWILGAGRGRKSGRKCADYAREDFLRVEVPEKLGFRSGRSRNARNSAIILKSATGFDTYKADTNTSRRGTRKNHHHSKAGQKRVSIKTFVGCPGLLAGFVLDCWLVLLELAGLA